jgi:hypothetical protein
MVSSVSAFQLQVSLKKTKTVNNYFEKVFGASQVSQPMSPDPVAEQTPPPLDAGESCRSATRPTWLNTHERGATRRSATSPASNNFAMHGREVEGIVAVAEMSKT